ncbi:hypothetical protein TcCL_ESM11289 [Trypanosoma cruzi]|nr:hypothetical protein TcCL_ESM11289 [Trypanosoma cruzi]
MAATTTAARHPGQMPLLRPGRPQQARKEPRTETSPAGLCPATIRRPESGPVCGRRRSRRAGVLARMVNARGVTRFQTLWKANSSGKPKTPGTPFKPPPATLAGTRARDGTTIAPPPWAAQPRPKPFPAFSARRRANRKADSVFIVTTSAIRAVPRQVGGVPVNMAIWLCPPRSNAFPVDPRTKRKRDYHPK